MSSKSLDKRALRVRQALERVLAGDVNAYEVVYEVCDGSLRSFLGSRYGHMGGDFVDEVAIRTHEHVLSQLHKFDSDRGASFQTWLNWQSRNVAHKVMAEWYGPKLVSFDEDRHAGYVATVAGPEEQYEVRERNRVLRQELKSLDEQGRLSIARHDLAGQTFHVTARHLGMTVSKMRRYRHGALAELRKRLTRRGIRPVEVDSTPGPVWYGHNTTGDEDDWTAPTCSVLPDGPDTLVGAAARTEEEVPDE